MSNNTVNMRGYLIYRTMGNINGTPYVKGWIYTGNTRMGGCHPFVVNGQPARVIISYIEDHAMVPIDEAPDFPVQAAGAVVRGKLVSHPKASYIDLRSVHFFQASLHAAHFILNDLTLGGHLTAVDRALRIVQVGSTKVPSFNANLATDAPYNGGVHPILLLNQQAEEMFARFQHTGFQSFRATVGGRLVTMDQGSLVQASFVCTEEEGSLVP